MGVDVSQINVDSTVGQVALLILIVSSAIVTLKPVITDLIKGMNKDGGKRKNYAVLANELKSTKNELDFAIRIQRNETQWQIVAREIIRLSRLELSNMSESTREKIDTLSTRLEEIEDRDVYSEYILAKEEDK